jgi:hypothetical protein
MQIGHKSQLLAVALAHLGTTISHAVFHDPLGTLTTEPHPTEGFTGQVVDGRAVTPEEAAAVHAQRHSEAALAMMEFFAAAQEAAFGAIVHLLPRASVEVLRKATEEGTLDELAAPPPAPPVPARAVAPAPAELTTEQLMAELAKRQSSGA